MRTVPPAFSRYALVLLVTLAGVGCPPFNGFKILSPVHGDVVTTASFDVTVKIDPAMLDAGSLVVKLNGQALTMSGGPEIFTSTVNPGSPLLDDNTLMANANKLVGGGNVGLSTQFQYLPPKARARLITDPADLISGPLAHGRVGDWLLENDLARFVVQDVDQRDLHSVGQYGGNIIDAELVEGGVRQGNDNFLEVQPAVNIESVINADGSVEVLNDGENGNPAQLRVCGPDDLLDYVNASSQVAELGVTLPQGSDDTDLDLDGCTTYTLAAGDRHVTMETVLTYNSGAPVSLYAGDYVNGAGELEQWTSNSAFLGSSPQGMGEMLANASLEVFSFFGFGQASGVDYALVPRPIAGASVLCKPCPVSSSFSTSGVSYVMAGTSIPLVLAGFDFPTFSNVPAGESRTFTRLFHIGDGSPGNAAELDLAQDGTPTGTIEGFVTVGGLPAPGARLVVGPQSGGTITDVTSLWVTDINGHYSGQLPVGTYGVAAGLQGVPYQGGGTYPSVNSVSITDGGLTNQDIDLPATGRVRVTVVDDLGNPIPGRVSAVGVDSSPEPELDFSEGPISGTTGLFRDITKDPLPYGLVWAEYTGAGGIAEFDLDPGTYEIYVSRGTEYSIYQESIALGSGPFGTVTKTVNAQIAKVVDSPGFVSSDYHVHMINSPDSRVSKEDRVRSFAGEGVDNLIATDHDAITDLGSVITTLGLDTFLHSTIGEEITSFDYGHFNAYPQAEDPAVPSRGSTDWAGPAPVGEDFPSFGNFSRTPAELEDEARNKLASDGSVQNAGLTTAVHVNHIGSHFGPLHIDTSLEPPASVLDPLAFDVNGNPAANNPLFMRLDPSVTNFFNAFDGLELWNGASDGAQNQFLDDRIGVWMNHLNQGIAITAIADTDTHTFLDLETAGARTWTPTSTGSDAPAAILGNDIGQSVRDGKAVGGQGIYVQASLVDTDTAQQADFSWLGSTLVTAADGTVDLEIEVQAPIWAPYDTIEVYTNAETCVAGQTLSGVDVEFGAIPDLIFTSNAGDFTVTTVNLPNGAQRLETSHTAALALAADTWVAVVVKGTQGATGSPPMFPVYPRSLSAAENPDLPSLITNTLTEEGTRALGFTNALYVDVDENALFDAPGCTGRCGVAACAP